MKLLITLILVYIIALPIILRLIALLHYKLITKKKLESNKSNKEVIILWNSWKEAISYTFKDKQNLQRKVKNKEGKSSYQDLKLEKRQMFFILWSVGLLLTIISALLNMWNLVFISYIMFFVSIIFAVYSPKKVLAERKKLIEQMYKIASNRLSIPADIPLKEAVKVLEWLDPLTPSKVQFYVPSTFAESGTRSFLEQFNQVFGQESAWVAFDNPENNEPGWNFKMERATFYSVPPLPKMAKFSEHYITDEKIAWSFFPIGLGVENGVEMVNPNTGEKEFIIGFDLFGEQLKMAEKYPDIKVATILGTAAPMALVAGGTGSGKALDSETLVATVIKE